MAVLDLNRFDAILQSIPFFAKSQNKNRTTTSIVVKGKPYLVSSRTDIPLLWLYSKKVQLLGPLKKDEDGSYGSFIRNLNTKLRGPDQSYQKNTLLKEIADSPIILNEDQHRVLDQADVLSEEQQQKVVEAVVENKNQQLAAGGQTERTGFSDLGQPPTPTPTHATDLGAQAIFNPQTSQPPGYPRSILNPQKIRQIETGTRRVLTESAPEVSFRAKMAIKRGVIPTIRREGGDFFRGLSSHTPILNLGRSGSGVTRMGRLGAVASRAASAGRLAAAGAAAEGLPLFLVILGIVVFLFLAFFLIGPFNGLRNTALCGLPGQTCGKGPGSGFMAKNLLTVTKNGPSKVAQGQIIDYNLVVDYTGLGTAEATLTDKIPENTEFVSAENGQFNDRTKTVLWTIQNISANRPKVVFLTVKPIRDNFIGWVTNKAEVSYKAHPGRGDEPPSQDTCGGTYILNNPYGNFGDPVCTFTKDQLYLLLKQLDPSNADYWFNQVVRCESPGYDPNAYNPRSKSGLGAFGLFQMNPGGNGLNQYDVGNVAWQKQIFNAVSYNNLVLEPLGIRWNYWQCAEDRW